MEKSENQEKLLSSGEIKDKSTSVLFVDDHPKQHLPSKYVALVKKKEVRKPLVNTLDTTLCLLLLVPCVVGFWRGTWILLEIHDNFTPAWWCVSWGVSVHVVFMLIQDKLSSFTREKSADTTRKILQLFVTRLYTYAFAVSNVMQWRGGWSYIDKIFSLAATPSGVVLNGNDMFFILAVGFLVCLILLKSLRNGLAVPFIFCTDNARKIFTFPTRFRTERTDTRKNAEVAASEEPKMRGSTAGFPDSRKIQQSASYYAVLSVLDALFSSLVVAPLVVGYWRSVWELMDIYVYPENAALSSCVSTAIGVVGHLMFMFPQHVLERYLHPDRNRILFYALSRAYTVCFAFICVNGWRGPWQLLDKFTGHELLAVAAPLLVGVVALAAMRALRNVSAAPFTVVTDSVKGYFEVVTMFRVAMNEKKSLYILDCLFSVIVIGSLVVFVWRGAWVLIDVYLFPESELRSAWGSLIVGYSTVGVAFVLQPFMRWLCDRITGISRVLAADLFLIISLIGTINVWRGIWNLLNKYLLPDNLELSCWITHWVCLVVLVLLGCSNSLIVRGVYIDAEEPAGECVVFPCYYLRLIFQQQKLKKMQKEQSKTEMANMKACENNHAASVRNHNEGGV